MTAAALDTPDFDAYVLFIIVSELITYLPR